MRCGWFRKKSSDGDDDPAGASAQLPPPSPAPNRRRSFIEVVLGTIAGENWTWSKTLQLALLMVVGFSAARLTGSEVAAIFSTIWEHVR